MKKILFILPVMAVFALWSCGPKETPEEKLTVTPPTINVEAGEEAVIREISVEATSAWEAAEELDWVEIKDVTATGFSIEIQPYIDGENESRQGVVTVTMGDKKQDVTITQGMMTMTVLTVTPPAINLGASEEVLSRQITVEASDAWIIESKPDWIGTKNITATGFTIDIEPYIDGEDDERSGKVVVKMGDLKQEVTVTQDVFMIPYVLTVNPESIDNAIYEVDYDVTVTASHGWEADTEADWINIDDVTDGGFNISVNAYPEELQDESRQGIVVVSSRDSEVEITVTQIKPVPEITPITAYLGLYTITGIMVNLGGGGEGRDYSTTGTMVLREDLGVNWLSIKVLGVNENFGEEKDLVFTYDNTTGLLSNNNYTLVGSPYTTTTLCYFGPAGYGTGYWPFAEGTISFGLDEGTGTITIPAKNMIDSEEKDVVICETRPLSAITRSMIGIRNVVLTKNQ